MPAHSDVYLGNPNLKKANTSQNFTKKQVAEYIKCRDNPVYFTEKYLQIVNVDAGLISFDMYDFQKEMMWKFHRNRFNIAKLPRQSGKSTIVTTYLLHYALFNENVNIAILANKAATAREMLSRLQLSYENLPRWMQQGIVAWNRGSLELENGSKIIAASTSASAIRGMSFNIVFLDEFAFIPNHICDQFFSSVYPTISSGKKSKVIIVSTPNGMNMFYKMWNDSLKGRNEYISTEVHWSEVPGRDAKWKEQTIRNTSQRQFTQEFECEFLGSQDTLIAPSKLKALSFDTPLQKSGGLDIYEPRKEGHDYVMTVDVARGTSQDYSAFCIFDITEFPYRLIGKYRNNEIKPILFPNIIVETARNYNNAHIMVEVNDIGDQVASIIQFDLEYQNLLMCAMRGRAGQVMGSGFSGGRAQLGVKMSKTVKKIGCSNLKALVEEDKLLINDYETIAELTTFVQKKDSFEADEGYNDDLVMCHVIFSWMVMQDYFREMTDQDIRKRIYDERSNEIEQDMAPFGFVDNGLDSDTVVDEDGNVWEVDEYGSKQYAVEYMMPYI
nr:terminase large subunit [uncultured Mediterranean phage uvMED]BAR29512.1 terminase large subunit [uncultured Mediterranean phage uvMED]